MNELASRRKSSTGHHHLLAGAGADRRNAADRRRRGVAPPSLSEETQRRSSTSWTDSDGGVFHVLLLPLAIARSQDGFLLVAFLSPPPISVHVYRYYFRFRADGSTCWDCVIMLLVVVAAAARVSDEPRGDDMMCCCAGSVVPTSSFPARYLFMRNAGVLGADGWVWGSRGSRSRWHWEWGLFGGGR